MLAAVLGRSWAALGPYVGGLGPLLGPMLAVLVALGTYVGGPGGSKAEKWPKPKQEGDLASGSRRKSGPNPSGKVIWQADQGGKAAQTRARRPFWGGNGFTMFSVAGTSCQFFSVDIKKNQALVKF